MKIEVPKIPKLKKGPMGYLLDARSAMNRVRSAIDQWCAAFDVGDNDALQLASEAMGEAMQDVQESLTKANEAGQQQNR